MTTIGARVILRKNNLTLVQWGDGEELRRAWVTPEMIESVNGENAQVIAPGRGLPYGEDWAALVTLTATPTQVDRELKRAGIWTLADLEARPNEALGAVLAAFRFDLGVLKRAASRKTLLSPSPSEQE